MSDILDIEEIKRDATGRLDVVKKTEELQAVVDKVYPGYRVKLTHASISDVRERTRNSAPLLPYSVQDFQALSGIEQMQLVLDDNGGPVELQDLHTRVVERGGSMTLTTMMSLLSKYQHKGKFVRVRRGLWALPSQVSQSQGSVMGANNGQ